MTNINSRPSWDEYFLEIARVTSLRATCRRRQVGCVFVDSQNRITATGYNGNIRGLPHCIDSPCPGVDYQSGTGLDLCEAQHAESNCVIQNKSDDILTVYTYPCTPCFTCAKMLANSKVKRVVARELYAHTNVINLFKDVGIQLDILGYNYETPNNGL